MMKDEDQKEKIDEETIQEHELNEKIEAQSQEAMKREKEESHDLLKGYEEQFYEDYLEEQKKVFSEEEEGDFQPREMIKTLEEEKEEEE